MSRQGTRRLAVRQTAATNPAARGSAPVVTRVCPDCGSELDEAEGRQFCLECNDWADNIAARVSAKAPAQTLVALCAVCKQPTSYTCPACGQPFCGRCRPSRLCPACEP